MSCRTRRTLATLALAFAVALGAGTSSAQNFTGRIDVVVTDTTGGVLPGVNVAISGPMHQAAVTDTRGEAHFLNLNVGNYTVAANLQGFNPWTSQDVQVVAGGAVPLKVQLGIAGAKETVQVTAESPVIDTKKQTTATNITLEEIQNIPNSRDPWVMMQTVPSIVVDRVSVGGSESGQQAGFIGKGVDSTQTTWNMDGIPITDMAATGASPGYYDFDMFQEMNVQTGGADPKASTGGIQLNFVMKSGTNAFHGMGKGYFENQGLQSTNLPSQYSYLAGKTGKGDRTDQYSDWGGELGGPILKDRWWFWGAYGDNDIRILKLNDTSDRTLLKDASFKTQSQLTNALRASFTYWYANKQKWGRGASATRVQAATWDQTGPNKLAKGEVNYVVRNNLFLTGRYAHLISGFQLAPEGGMGVNAYINDARLNLGSADFYKSDRPQDVAMADGNWFRGNHELKFGFSWRKAPVHSSDVWPGSQIQSKYRGYPNMLATVHAPGATDDEGRYTNFYAGDTMTFSRLTLNAGIRYDHQASSVLPTSLPTVTGFESLLPSVTAPGVKNALVWNTWGPRVGATFALDSSHKTQLRATYSLFTSQMGNGAASFLSVAQYRSATYTAVDTNGNGVADPSEIDFSNLVSYGGFDPANPGGIAQSYNKVGSYKPPKTHEVVLGVDHQLMANFGLNASFTYRYNMDFAWQPYIGVTSADYALGGYLTGTLPQGIPGVSGDSYNVPYYWLNEAVAPVGLGTVYETRPDYHQRYLGFEVNAVKRMSNRWMMRLGFSSNRWQEFFGPNGLLDPTRTNTSPNINGGDVPIEASGSGKSEIYMTQPRYQFIANGAYEAPLGIDLGANFLVRQGYPMPWYGEAPGDITTDTKYVLLSPSFTASRLPAVKELDLRVGKTVKLSSSQIDFDFDIFNALNTATILGRQYDAAAEGGSTGFPNVTEIMQPRIARLGLRITF